MDLAQKYSILYTKKKNVEVYKGDDTYSREFVNYILERFEEERDKNVEKMKTSMDIVTNETCIANMKAQEEDFLLKLKELRTTIKS